MYAIIATGGKQYRVEVGTEVEVEKINEEIGKEVKIPVIAVMGEGAKISTSTKSATAKILEHGRGEKLNIFRYKPKKNVRKRIGHRQPYTKIVITAI